MLLRGAERTAMTPAGRWLDITVWGGVLVITGYSMGTLYEHKASQMRELRETYHGVLMILRHFIAKDAYTENHSYRVSVYAAKIAASLDLTPDAHRGRARGRAAARHRQARHQPRAALQGGPADQRGVRGDAAARRARASRCSSRRRIAAPRHPDRAGASRQVRRHRDTTRPRGEDIPLEARIISVADVYDSLTSDRPYRKAMSPFDAKDIIVKGSGTDFDPKVVEAFLKAFKLGKLEIWSAAVSA